MNTELVKDFLKNDYPRLELMTGKETTKINVNDNSRLSYYQNVFNLVCMTLDKMENTAKHPYKKLIIERYIRHNRPLKEISLLVGYKRSTTFKKMNEALICFAEEFSQLQREYKVYPLIDFTGSTN